MIHFKNRLGGLNMSDFSELAQNIIDARRNKVIELVKDGLEKNVEPQSLLSDHMIPAMLEVGRLMEEGEYFIPEVLQSAKAMKAGMEILEPILLASGSAESEGHVILGTVDGDIHDIGKNLVATLLKGSGFTVNDLGTSVTKEKFLEVAQEKDGPIVLGMSTLITPTMDEMSEVIKVIEDAGIRDRVKIMVGGAPVDQEFADSIRADGTAPDAASAVRLAKKLLED
jgi:5-methyltetrahydrofolate--homocysteine methyltransferase